MFARPATYGLHACGRAQAVTQDHGRYEAHIEAILASHRKSAEVRERRKLAAVPHTGGLQRGDRRRLPVLFREPAGEDGAPDGGGARAGAAAAGKPGARAAPATLAAEDPCAALKTLTCSVLGGARRANMVTVAGMREQCPWLTSPL